MGHRVVRDRHNSDVDDAALARHRAPRAQLCARILATATVQLTVRSLAHVSAMRCRVRTVVRPFLPVCLTICSFLGHGAPRPSTWISIPASKLCVTEGALGMASGGGFSV